MALTDASAKRRILAGILPVEVLLAGTGVKEGDALMYSTGWYPAINESGAEAILIAGQAGSGGETITAYGAAVIELTHTAANVPTEGQIVALTDTNLYGSVAGGKQDIGHIVNIDSDNLKSRAIVWPGQVAYDTAGT